MKRFWSLAIILVLVFALVVTTAGCGGGMSKGSAIKGKTVVTFWHAMSGPHEAALKKIVADFNKANEKYIEVQLVYQGSYTDLSNKLTAALAANTPPTMAQQYENWTAQYIAAQKLVPVQTFIDNPNYGMKKEEFEDIYKVFRDQNTWDGKMYTMPMNKSTNVLFVNTDLIKTIPTTWDEFRKVAKAVSKTDPDPKKSVYGFGYRTTVDQFGFLLKQNGGDWLDKDGKAAFNSQAGIDALQFLLDMTDEKSAYRIGTGYESDVFGPGTIAMYEGSIAGISFVDSLSKGKHAWTVAKMPKGKVEASTVMGTNVGIFAKAKPAEQEAAWRFIKYLVSAEPQAYWAQQTGYTPVVQSATKTKTWTDMVAQKPYWNAIAEELKVSTLDPRMSAWDKCRTEISSAVEKAVLKKATAKEALDAAAAKVNELLGKK